MERAISYIDYDRLSDDLLFLGNSTVVRFNVTLAKVSNKDGTKVHYHREYRYPSSKYADADTAITMRRSFEFYLSIDRLDAREASVMIRVQDIILLRAKLNEAASWFNDNTFGIKNRKLYIINRPNPAIITGLPDNKSIMFEPIVIEWENDNVQQQGIRMTLTDSNIYTDITIDRFYGFVYLINSINMYESAQLMINYLGRPEFGTNMTEFENNNFLTDHYETVEPENIVSKNREIKNKPRNKSFFDKVDEL